MATTLRARHWTRKEIAALSFSQVAELNYDEMIRLVLDSGVPFRDVKSLHTMDGDVLMRHVHWARQYCRRETTWPR
ncbi:MAG TPA: hypothetical protein VHX65_08070 [Pirellulales bacterium]|jgi:hypothetical protein|nr:hypothetical protein [Pirellulales bacterium]